MNVQYTQEQQLVQRSALEWLQARYSHTDRARSVHRDGGSANAWSQFAELGWLALPLGEDSGGLAGDALTTGLLTEALGRHLVVEPYVEQVLLAARAIDSAGSEAQRADWLPRIASGAARVAWAHHEPTDALGHARRRCTATAVSGGWQLSGRKHLVRGAAGAHAWVVSASLEGSPDTELLFLIPSDAMRVGMESYTTTDDGFASDLRFERVFIDRRHILDDAACDAHAMTRRLVAEGVVASCWYALGAMDNALELTVRHIQERQQFGQPLARFQVMQHRIAEMSVQVVEARAACELAALALRGAGTTADAQAIAASVKNKVARAAQLVSQDCVQLHGAMGVCEELPIAATFRTLLCFGQECGTAEAHAALLGAHSMETHQYAQSRTLGA